MEILLLYGAISKHYIKIAANDRVNLDKLQQMQSSIIAVMLCQACTHQSMFFIRRILFWWKNAISIIKRVDRELTTHWYLLEMYAIKMYLI